MTGTTHSPKSRLPLVALLVAFAFAAGGATSPADGLPQLSRFVWSEEGEAISFSIQMNSASKAPRLTDEIAQKKYFYLDFFNCQGPTEEKLWTLSHPLVTSVRRVYYPAAKALRLVFFTATNRPLNLSNTGLGTDYTLKAAPIAMRSLGMVTPGKPGTRKIVVIDPGHGGRSTGAQTSRTVHGRHYLEKEITLQIAQRLASLIKQSPNMDCVLTRNADQDVGLEERVSIAEAAKGDVFMSIHLNATDTRAKTARGVEVYYLSDTNKATNKQLELLENEGTLSAGTNANSTPEVKSMLGNLLGEMAQTRKQESLRFSALVDDSFRKQGPFSAHPRGMKSAAFKVLMNFGMPAVLVETGFIDNPQDAELVTNPVSQQQIATVLFNALNRYFAQADPKFQPREVALQSTAPPLAAAASTGPVTAKAPAASTTAKPEIPTTKPVSNQSGAKKSKSTTKPKSATRTTSRKK